jgi:hypothetical protein
MEIEADSVVLGLGEERHGRLGQQGSGGCEVGGTQNKQLEEALKVLLNTRGHTGAKACEAHVGSRN